MARKRGSGAGGVGGGARREVERVRTARRRKAGSTRWLQRQLNDPYVQQARKSGYRSRAAFKLGQIDDRFSLLRPGARVVDLGAAPGGWTQVAVERVRPQETGGQVVAFDLSEMESVAGALVLRGDIYDETAPAALRAALTGPADVVLCDMAAPATGHAATDHLRTLALGEAAFELACELLAEGGAFVVKVLQGADEPAFFAALRQRFTTVRRHKPPASRRDSTELYLVATGFRGATRAVGAK